MTDLFSVFFSITFDSNLTILRSISESLRLSPESDSPDDISKMQMHKNFSHIKIIIGMAIVLLIATVYWFLSKEGFLDIVMDWEVLQEHIDRLGALGPLAVIGLMAGAIVFSPLPSAPVALAAGVVFGHTWGTIYILIGAETGALVAFSVSRLLGHDLLQKWFGKRISKNWFGSQKTLMAVVFISRLIPFISFDIVSYASGLTSLSLWRFALATLGGIIPASFLLAHFGGEISSLDTSRIMISVVVIGGITLLPVVVRVIQKRIFSGKTSTFNS